MQAKEWGRKNVLYCVDPAAYTHTLLHTCLCRDTLILQKRSHNMRCNSTFLSLSKKNDSSNKKETRNNQLNETKRRKYTKNLARAHTHRAREQHTQPIPQHIRYTALYLSLAKNGERNKTAVAARKNQNEQWKKNEWRKKNSAYSERQKERGSEC